MFTDHVAQNPDVLCSLLNDLPPSLHSSWCPLGSMTCSRDSCRLLKTWRGHCPVQGSQCGGRSGLPLIRYTQSCCCPRAGDSRVPRPGLVWQSGGQAAVGGLLLSSLGVLAAPRLKFTQWPGRLSSVPHGRLCSPPAPRFGGWDCGPDLCGVSWAECCSPACSPAAQPAGQGLVRTLLKASGRPTLWWVGSPSG